MANTQNLKPFGKGNQAAKGHGRPKKIETVLQELFYIEYNHKLSKTQCTDIVSILLNKNMQEISEMAVNESLPFWILLIAKKAQDDYEKGSIDLVEKLFDRVFGKPKHSGKSEQVVNQETKLNFSKLSVLELKQLRDLMKKARE